jgi:hypothetical protein
MEVNVHNVWASPSTLHMRVTVWPNSRLWRQKFDVAVPISTIPVESISALWQGYLDTEREDMRDIPLF